MRRALHRALSAVPLCFVCFGLAFGPAVADVRIEASPGGDVLPFIAFFTSLRQSGERVVIDGPCLSACTLVLSTIPRSRICVTRRAVLGFHAAKIIDQYGDQYPAAAAAVTRVVGASYPAPVRSWIARHGGLSRRPIYLHGRELAAMYPLCR